MKAGIRGLVWIAVVLLLSGCGARVAPPLVIDPSAVSLDGQGLNGRAVLGEGGAGSFSDSPSAASPSAGSLSVGRSSNASRGSTSPPALPADEVVITLSKPCAEPLDAMTAHIVGPARALFMHVVGYTDRDPHGTMGGGHSDARGVYDWTFVVAADAPPGAAIVAVTATGQGYLEGEETSRGGRGQTSFTVAASGGCPP